ncbi:MAG: M15 family metallopeptidase [Gemmatimonadota bacterium]
MNAKRSSFLAAVLAAQVVTSACAQAPIPEPSSAGRGTGEAASAQEGRADSSALARERTANTSPPAGLVDALAVDSTLVLDVRYATPDNFTGTTLYPVARCLLRAPIAERLARVHARLRSEGLRLKLFDCYRPLSIQRKLWALVPDERYVANPEKGSRHNRGAAVDLTLVDDSGAELPMPTEYDDFTPRAHRDYGGGTADQNANRQRLEDAMTAEGFEPLPTEWWHFDAPDWKEHAILDVPLSCAERACTPVHQLANPPGGS